MFSETERKAALKLLFRTYLANRSTPFAGLCECFGVTIERAHLRDKKGAYLLGAYPPWTVMISSEALCVELVRFLVYHEIAEGLLYMHLRLRDGDKEEYWEKECWCDGFATAMSLADFCIHAMTEENYVSFLTEGTGRAGVDTIDKLQADRIRTFCTNNEIHAGLSALANELST